MFLLPMFNVFSYLPTRSSSQIETSSQNATLREKEVEKESLEIKYNKPILKNPSSHKKKPLLQQIHKLARKESSVIHY